MLRLKELTNRDLITGVGRARSLFLRWTPSALRFWRPPTAPAHVPQLLILTDASFGASFPPPFGLGERIYERRGDAERGGEGREQRVGLRVVFERLEPSQGFLRADAGHSQASERGQTN